MKKVFILSVLLFSNFAFALELRDGSNNILSSALEGTWTVDRQLSARLFGMEEDALPQVMMTFTRDSSVLSGINARENGRSLDKRAYSVGRVVVKENGEVLNPQTVYYAVINRDGDPTLAMFDPEANQGRGDWEFAQISIARARDLINDILFIGGDHREPTFPLVRTARGD